MKTVALVSGGKDSCFNMMHCVAEGHTIVALANLRPKDKDELDSYMFQTVGHHAIELYADAMGLPLYRRTLEGGSVNQSKDYNTTVDDEVEDLYQLLSEIKKEVEYEAVSVGAILSDYQRVRVEHVCLRLSVTPLAYLWRRDQTELLAEMIECGVKAVLIKVAALGLTPEKHLGKSLAQIQSHMLNMHSRYGLNPCGEGGEYETFTLDCPLFKKYIVVDEQEMVMHSSDPICPVAYLNFTSIHLENKENVAENQQERMKHLPLKRCKQMCDELYVGTSPPASNPQHCITPEDACINCTLNRLEYTLPCEQNLENGWVFCSGIYGTLEDGCTVEEQTCAAMKRLEGILSKHQMKFSHLVAVHVYVKHMSDFARINNIYKTYFSINPPIRICVEADLPSNVSVQLDAIAYHSGDEIAHKTMHVQSVSHWAAANIGPYSQCVQINDFKLYVAGQIALVPGSMRIIEGGIYAQCRLCLRHVDRVLRAMQALTASPLHIGCVRLAICYVTAKSFIEAAGEEWTEYHKRISEEESMSSYDTTELVEYVVVSHLPRDALIEWQVQAVPSCAQIAKYSTSVKGGDTFNANCMCCVSQMDTDLSVNFMCRLEYSEEIDEILSLSKEQIVEAVVTTLKCISEAIAGVAREGHEHNPSPDMYPKVKMLRIFYSVAHFDINILYREYISACMAEGEAHHISSVPAFVPVRTFKNPKQLLSVCH